MRTYIAIDLKSFYASVECIDRGLDPMTTNLVVADKSRTERSASPFRPLSRPTAYPAGRGCSRSCRKCAKSTGSGRGMHRTAN